MKKKETTAKYAPGIDDQEELNENATENEKHKGEYTEVTTLSYDEVEPSS